MFVGDKQTGQRGEMNLIGRNGHSASRRGAAMTPSTAGAATGPLTMKPGLARTARMFRWTMTRESDKGKKDVQ